jgi:RNA polymerase sigma factor (sigma-70 family)
MATARPAAVLRHIRGLAAERTANERTDGELIEAFLARGDQPAFEVILRRHGPLVLRVCRRVLGDLHDAEDAFQATFLFLAQQAGSVRKRGSLASWLHGVARRMAANARRSAARRTRHERQATSPTAASDPAWQSAWREVQSVLDEEIQRLPETYREPLVRCCLEHRSCAEVAAHMGLREPAVRSRVSRARKLLEVRLGRRGVSLALLSTAVAVSAGRATAEVAPDLLGATAAAARLVTGQGSAAGLVSAKVAALLRGANQAILFTKIRTAFVALLGTLLLAGGTALVYGRGLAADRDGPRAAEAPPADGQPRDAAAARAQPGNGPHTDHYGDPLPDEALARLGTTRFRPGDHVLFLRFSRDGTKLVTQSSSGLRVWNATTGRELRRFGPAGGVGVRAADVSADAKLALTVDADQHGTLRLWDVETGRALSECGRAHGFGPVLLSPDGKTVAAAGPSGEIELRDATTGERRHTLKEPTDLNSSAAFSADGKTLVTRGTGKAIRFWDVATGQQVRHIDAPEDVGLVALSPDGKLLASVAFRREVTGAGIITWGPVNQVRVWNADTGKELRQLAVGAKGFGAVAFAPDSKTLVTVSGDDVLRVWDATTGKELRAFPDCSTNIRALALTADGKSAAFVNGGTALRVVDLATGKDRVPLTGHAGGVYTAAVTPDGRRVITAGGDDTVYVWDPATGKEIRRLRGHRAWAAALALSPDGRWLYSLGSDRAVRVCDTVTGKERRLDGDYEATSFGALALSRDGRLLAAVRPDKSLVLIDAASGKSIRTASLEGQTCCGAGFAPDGRTLVAWTDEQGVFVLDVATGKVRTHFPFIGDEDKRLAYVGALSPDGRLIAFGSQRHFLSLQEVDTGKEVYRFDHLPDGVSAVAFSPDGRTLAWGGWNDPTVRLLELSTRGERHHFIGHQGRILALHFSPDGRVLVSGGNDATALVWDLAGGAGAKAAGEKEPSAEELASLWKDLGTADAAQAYRTVGRLVRSRAAIEFLGTQVRPVPAPDEKRVAKLIADLDADEFDVRDQATRELERLGDQAVGACRKALAGQPSPEMRRRLGALLDGQSADGQQPSVERLRLMRALEALERAGTDQARGLLAALAKGAPGAWLTEEARAAGERLDRLATSAR